MWPACIAVAASVLHSVAAGPDLPELVETQSPSIVELRWIRDGEVVGSGTGFFVSQDLVATNWHVAAGDMGAETLEMWTIDGRELPASFLNVVLWASEEDDLALIATPWGLLPPTDQTPEMQPIRWRRDVPQVGTEVVVIGNALGIGISASNGIVSAYRPDDPTLPPLQLSAPVSPGSSGSPVFVDGHAVAMVVGSLRGGQQVNFAVPFSRLPDPLPLVTRETMGSGNFILPWAGKRATDAEVNFVRETFTTYWEVVDGLPLPPIRLDADEREVPRLEYALALFDPEFRADNEWPGKFDFDALVALSERCRVAAGMVDAGFSPEVLHWAAGFDFDDDALVLAFEVWPEDDALRWMDIERRVSNAAMPFKRIGLFGRQLEDAYTDFLSQGGEIPLPDNAAPELVSAIGALATRLGWFAEARSAIDKSEVSSIREDLLKLVAGDPRWASTSDFHKLLGETELMRGEIDVAMRHLTDRRFQFPLAFPAPSVTGRSLTDQLSQGRPTLASTFDRLALEGLLASGVITAADVHELAETFSRVGRDAADANDSQPLTEVICRWELEALADALATFARVEAVLSRVKPAHERRADLDQVNRIRVIRDRYVSDIFPEEVRGRESER